MLEFRDEFFDQEIREGFYIDETMKRVWSAQLEVLQVIAEICDRHGLQWFAVFGTLLGAIRHEGFVPWDDDMDIGMMREDYMKFLKVLPEELPKGFKYFSPMSPDGYTEYHSVVLSGNTVNISPEWLERFHGCPFSVGIDVFPFDYLPRNEGERKVQKNLFDMVCRAVQMIKNLTDPTVEKNEFTEKEDEIYEKELMEALDALKEYCRFRVNEEAVRNKQWEKLYGPLWKLGNELAMMYGEEEADEIVMYSDYASWERKRYPKEWFSEIYAATYEDFMIPVPCGYDGFLKTIYGDYLRRVRAKAMHEYPYYARQLRMVREKVKQFENQARDIGLIQRTSEIGSDEDTVPEEWQQLLDQRSFGKKVMLFGNEYESFFLHGKEALDKLEEALETFYKRRDKVILWWRIKPKMAELLAQIDPALGERFSKIRNEYIQGAWGILDESGNADLAAKECDAYYGDMGYVLQPLQNQNKPILLITYEKKKEEEAQTC